MATNPNRPPHQQALDVTPISSMPYIGPLGSHGKYSPLLTREDTKPTKDDKPALVYLPSQPTEEEGNNIVSVTKSGICLSGSAMKGTVGPVLGKMDIGESEECYIFRVSLPGVASEAFACDVAPDGQVLIKGFTTTGEKIVYKNSQRFEMQSQNLCPPGHFSISFKLPGPVDPKHLQCHFGIDGVLEAIVRKRIQPN